MTERPFSPEEFVRLLSLPETHPERVRAEASGMLEAWRRMLGEFMLRLRQPLTAPAVLTLGFDEGTTLTAQIGPERNRALVVEVRARHGRAVQLGLEQRQAHGGVISSLSPC